MKSQPIHMHTLAMLFMTFELLDIDITQGLADTIVNIIEDHGYDPKTLEKRI
jgi:hypothetical protein